MSMSWKTIRVSFKFSGCTWGGCEVTRLAPLLRARFLRPELLSAGLAALTPVQTHFHKTLQPYNPNTLTPYSNESSRRSRVRRSMLPTAMTVNLPTRRDSTSSPLRGAIRHPSDMAQAWSPTNSKSVTARRLSE